MKNLDVTSSKLSRIMVFGLPGSGKSTFPTKLANELKLPIQKSFVDQTRSVIDGNAMRSLEMRFERADMAIYFHYPVLMCLWRILKRVFQKDWHLHDLAEGCTKSVRFKLMKYLFQFHRRYKNEIERLCHKYPHVRFYTLKSDAQAIQFLELLREKN